jgi:hypothetical protein
LRRGSAGFASWGTAGWSVGSSSASAGLRWARAIPHGLDGGSTRRSSGSDAWATRAAKRGALQGLAAAAMQERDLDGAADLVLRSVGPARRAHSRGEIACAFRLLATVAAARGRPEIAAELLAAADIASPGTGDAWAVDADGLPSPEPATLRAALGDEAFEECWGRGRSMTTDEAFELGAALAGATSIGSAASQPHA